MTSPALRVKNLSVQIPTANGPLNAVRNISFEIARGETVCLVGESGCGKSMTALSVMGLAPARAKVSLQALEIDGQPMPPVGSSALNRLRGDRIAMIFQEPMTALNPAYTVGNQMMEGYRRHRPGRHAEARERALELLGKVGIGSAVDRLDQYPHQLSGGLRQRVMIAMALMCNPVVLLADEPTTALDVTIQVQILQLLHRLKQEFGIGLLLITHDLGVVARVADRVHVMYAGQIVESATAENLFHDPRHPYTKALLRSLPAGATHRGALETIPGTVPSLIGEMDRCAFFDRCAYASAATCMGHIEVRGAESGHSYRCVMEVA